MNIADAQIIKKIKSKKTDVEVKIVHCCEERRKASPSTYRLGPSHLRALAASLARAREGRPADVPRYSATAALARNLALFPVILAHGFRRLLPF